MKTLSILDDDDRQMDDRSGELLFYSGLLLSGLLLTIWCLAGGILSLVTVACVLICGFGLGYILRRYSPYTILPTLNEIALLPGSNKPAILPAV